MSLTADEKIELAALTKKSVAASDVAISDDAYEYKGEIVNPTEDMGFTTKAEVDRYKELIKKDAVDFIQNFKA